MVDSYAVIIPTRNRPESLVRAVSSVLSQTIAPREVFVVDNSSAGTGLTPSDVSALGPLVKVVSAPDAPNAAAVRNRALAKVTARYAAFLDDDDEWLPRKMEAQLALLESNRRYVGVVCGRRVVAGNSSRLEIPSPDGLNWLLEYDNFGGSFSFIVFDRQRCSTLMLDERLTAFQDWDFLLRLRRHGEIGLVAEELAIYCDHTGPRITSNIRGRRRSLQTVCATHRTLLSSDARLWIHSRILALAYQERTIRGDRPSLQLILRSIVVGARTRFPIWLKLRAIAGRIVLTFPPQLAGSIHGAAKAIKRFAS